MKCCREWEMQSGHGKGDGDGVGDGDDDLAVPTTSIFSDNDVDMAMDEVRRRRWQLQAGNGGREGGSWENSLDRKRNIRKSMRAMKIAQSRRHLQLDPLWKTITQ